MNMLSFPESYNEKMGNKSQFTRLSKYSHSIDGWKVKAIEIYNFIMQASNSRWQCWPMTILTNNRFFINKRSWIKHFAGILIKFAIYLDS